MSGSPAQQWAKGSERLLAGRTVLWLTLLHVFGRYVSLFQPQYRLYRQFALFLAAIHSSSHISLVCIHSCVTLYVMERTIELSSFPHRKASLLPSFLITLMMRTWTAPSLETKNKVRHRQYRAPELGECDIPPPRRPPTLQLTPQNELQPQTHTVFLNS